MGILDRILHAASQRTLEPDPEWESPRRDRQGNWVHGLPPREVSRYAGQYGKNADWRRTSQIFTESGRLAVNSKDPDTAWRCFELALECFYSLMRSPAPKESKDDLLTALQKLVDAFPAWVRMQEASRICERGDRLAMVNKKLEYLRSAEAVLRDGLTLYDGDHPGLRDLHAQVLSKIEEAERLLQEGIMRAWGTH